MDKLSEFETFRQRYQQAMVEKFGKENMLLFWGNQYAKIVHIGQAPSRLGVLHQRPFADKTGEKLRRQWYQVSDDVFYNPDNFYLTALGMYFPGKDKHGGDKQPDLAFAKVWLTQELEFLSPKLIVLLGKMASGFFFPGRKFEELVFNDQVIKQVPAIVLPHASPLNIKWFKDHPEFESQRLLKTRRMIHEALSRYNQTHVTRRS